VKRPTIAVTYSSPELGEFKLWRHMFEGIVEAGGVPLAIDCATHVPEIESLVRRVDGLMIGGGGDIDPRRYGADPRDPIIRGVNVQRDENELRAWQTARDLGMPVLAICRGAQLLTVELGGDLYIDLSRDFRTTIRHDNTEDELVVTAHEVALAPGSRVAAWHGGASYAPVNSQHHQGIKRIAPGTVETARSSDGLTEAYELAEANLVAVQWHPEVLWKTSPLQLRFLKNFIAEAERASFRAQTQDLAGASLLPD
jgi:putative glutamine amidotransferase